MVMEKCEYCESELIICEDCKRMVCPQCDCPYPVKVCYHCDDTDYNDYDDFNYDEYDVSDCDDDYEDEHDLNDII